MKKHTSFFFLFILFGYFTNAQSINVESGTTRAVVVGISDYQDENITDLNYAHKDAEVFVNFLRSPAGGNLEDNHIKLLLNEDATQGKLGMALYWLMEESKEGDRAIIYFSGHGDVEKKIFGQPGYLLCWDAPSKVYMFGGTLDLDGLKRIVTTLSKNIKAKVILITDACRAGKLAGSEIGGAQATTASLKEQYANELKILSCQPTEFSLEGEQWGGGRGAFSYHLIEGLNGLADKNGDLQVNLYEIGRYLEDNVPQETAPHPQMPLTIGNRTSTIVNVDVKTLADLKIKKEKELGTLGFIDTKGIESQILVKTDTSVQELYERFLTALESGNLLEPNGQSANDYYEKLILEDDLKEIHGFLKRNFAAALQDDAQQAIIAYLLANPSELQKRYNKEKHYDYFPKYLQRAAELLGPSHIYYKSLLANQYYFEGLQLRLEADKVPGADTLYQKAIDKQVIALEYQPNAPFVLNELGVLYTRLKQDEKAFEYLDKAIELSPEWGLPYVNYSIGLYYNGQYEKAIEYGKLAGQKLGNFPQVYCLLSWLNLRDYEWKDNRNLERKGVELQDDYEFDWMLWGTFEGTTLERFDKSAEYLHKAIIADPNYTNAYYYLGYIKYQKYMETGMVDELELAIENFEKYISLKPESDIGYGWMGLSLLDLNRYEEASQNFEKAIKINPLEVRWLGGLGMAYELLHQYDLAIEALTQALEIEENPKLYGRLAYIYWVGKKDSKLCELNSLKAVKIGLENDIPQRFLYMGIFYKWMHRYIDSERFLLKAMESMPDVLGAAMQLGYTYRESGQTKKSVELCDNLAAKYPNNKNPNFHWWLGYQYLNLNIMDKADFHFQKVFEMDENTSYLGSIGCSYCAVGEFEKALNFLTPLKFDFLDYDAINPKVCEAWAYFELGDVEKTHQIMEKTIESNTKSDLRALDTELYWHHALFYYYSGDIEQTNKWLDKAIEFDPDFILRKKALNLFEQGDFDGATEYFEQIMELCGTCREEKCCFDVAYIYSRLKAKQEKYQEALDLLSTALNMGIPFTFIQKDKAIDPIRNSLRFKTMIRRTFPSKFDDLDQYDLKEPGDPFYNPENCLLLSNIYLKMDKPKWSAELCLKAIELQPGYEEAYVQLSAIYRENEDIQFEKSKISKLRNSEEHKPYVDKYFPN